MKKIILFFLAHVFLLSNLAWADNAAQREDIPFFIRNPSSTDYLDLLAGTYGTANAFAISPQTGGSVKLINATQSNSAPAILGVEASSSFHADFQLLNSSAVEQGDLRMESTGNWGLYYAAQNGGGDYVFLVNHGSGEINSSVYPREASGFATGYNLTANLAQTGTAGYALYYGNANEGGGLGSGNHFLLELQNTSADRFTVDDNGNLNAAGGVTGQSLSTQGTINEVGVFSGISGISYAANISPTVSQGGSATFNGIYEDASFNSTGSGGAYLLNIGRAGTPLLTMDSTGLFALTGGWSQTQASGNVYAMQVNAQMNTGGTAGFAGIFSNITGAQTGSGPKWLLELQDNSSDKMTVDTAGNVSANQFTAGANVTASGGFDTNNYGSVNETALGTLTWTGTAPSSISTIFKEQSLGVNAAHVDIIISASVAGSANTQVSFALPGSCPTPHPWSGISTSPYIGAGQLSAGTTPAISAAGTCYLYNNAGTWTVVIGNTASVAAKAGYCSLTYSLN